MDELETDVGAVEAENVVRGVDALSEIGVPRTETASELAAVWEILPLRLPQYPEEPTSEKPARDGAY